jgi:hypothetical protein
MKFRPGHLMPASLRGGQEHVGTVCADGRVCACHIARYPFGSNLELSIFKTGMLI